MTWTRKCRCPSSGRGKDLQPRILISAKNLQGIKPMILKMGKFMDFRSKISLKNFFPMQLQIFFPVSMSEITFCFFLDEIYFLMWPFLLVLLQGVLSIGASDFKQYQSNIWWIWEEIAGAPWHFKVNFNWHFCIQTF